MILLPMVPPMDLTSINHDLTVSNKRQVKQPVNMLSSSVPGGDSAHANFIKNYSANLDFVPIRKTGFNVPRSVAASSDASIREIMLPCVIRRGDTTIEIYANYDAKKPDDRDFWTMLAKGIEAHKPLPTDKIFPIGISKSAQAIQSPSIFLTAVNPNARPCLCENCNPRYFAWSLPSFIFRDRGKFTYHEVVQQRP